MSDIADCQDYQLDPRVIRLHQVTGAILLVVTAFWSFAGLIIGMLVGDSLTGAVRIGLLLLWAILVGLGAWHAVRWPARTYAHTFYRVDEQGIEIRRGVYWRVVINVPKSRVQHIDVTQGPIDRRFELGTLVVHTAGTDHAKVALDGLEHGRALAIREHLLPSGAGDAV
ncbi:MAG TPA: PH domain-containing protein [Vicinamibacterales bacterium]|nr:PH domain-containing protein [Vicinamibacterales bacterium]